MTSTEGTSLYPAHREVDVALRDGSTVRVRPTRPDDLGAIEALFARISRESSRMRFHGSASPSHQMLERFVDVDYRSSLSLLSETGLDEGRKAIALATYIRSGDERAEMA